jgi:nucleoside-diphosphate-sugar epimerase
MGVVAVTGGNGFVGRALVQAFRRAGAPVIPLVRRPAQDGERSFDLRNAANVDLSGVDVLVHCALEPYRDGDASPDDVNVDGSRMLFEVARAAGVRRCVFISSTAARPDASSPYGRQKFAVEACLGPDDLVIRPGLVIGPGGLFKTMFDAIEKRGIAPIFSGGSQPVYFVALRDLAEVVVELVQRGRTGLVIAAAPEPATMKRVYETIARVAARPLRLIPLPYGPVMFVLRCAERLGVHLPITSGSLRSLAGMRALAFSNESVINFPFEHLEAAIVAATAG